MQIQRTRLHCRYNNKCWQTCQTTACLPISETRCEKNRRIGLSCTFVMILWFLSLHLENVWTILLVFACVMRTHPIERLTPAVSLQSPVRQPSASSEVIFFRRIWRNFVLLPRWPLGCLESIKDVRREEVDQYRLENELSPTDNLEARSPLFGVLHAAIG